MSALSRPIQQKLRYANQLSITRGRRETSSTKSNLIPRGMNGHWELIIAHQNPQQLSTNLWAAVWARGCQFLGPGTVNRSIACVHHFQWSQYSYLWFPFDSNVRRSVKAGAAGTGGWLSAVTKGTGYVCGARTRTTLSPGFKNQHRSRPAATL